MCEDGSRSFSGMRKLRCREVISYYMEIPARSRFFCVCVKAKYTDTAYVVVLVYSAIGTGCAKRAVRFKNLNRYR